MIGFVQGKIISLHPEGLECVLLSGEVGYELLITKKTAESLTLNQFVSFWIHTHVREDALLFYGFLTEMEKKFFRILLNVQGLGPKTALALLSEHGVEKLTQYILEKNTNEIATAPGIGKKIAERLVLELQNKIEKLPWILQVQKSSTTPKTIKQDRQLKEDLTSALSHLGYAPNQIKNSLEKLFEKKDIEKEGFEVLLKTVLKDISGRSHSAPIESGGHS